jgi:hypothetical protein
LNNTFKYSFLNYSLFKISLKLLLNKIPRFFWNSVLFLRPPFCNHRPHFLSHNITFETWIETGISCFTGSPPWRFFVYLIRGKIPSTTTKDFSQQSKKLFRWNLLISCNYFILSPILHGYFSFVHTTSFANEIIF